MKNNNIIHIFGKMEFGGAELRTIEIMDNMQNSFENIYFCTMSGEKGRLAKELNEKGYNVIPCNIFSLSFPMEFMKILKKNNIDIVHSHISIVSGYIMFLSFLAGVNKRIVHFRSSKIGKTRSVKEKIKTGVLKLLILTFATDIVAVNRYTMVNHFKNYKKIKKCKILYNGKGMLYSEDERKIRQFKSEYSIKNDEKVIIHIGRFNEAKNHYKVISVFNSFNKIVPKSKLLLIGDNNSELGQNIQDLVKNQNLENKVLFLGRQSNIKDFLSISDVLLFPSYWEGLPGVVLESLSAGIPVLGSNIGGHYEISDTNDGITIVPLNSSDQEWSRTLKSIVYSGKQRQIADSFRKSPYYIEEVLKHFEILYDSN
ncbi:glycosyltransferase [Salimicrobium humidisoli]|uniref:Glycosyl transferase family 1 domain-containing protein n=1 Tax=Salimicrobium humidisoli TaxID=2029857 RepID=A0ABX4HUF4_9BACI|nr:glycosyltransferase [Salimicrobium humidisoli]PBB06459.1 hypothetical protein CKW00_03785 [Salimicrobium humidisoli]